MNDSVKMKPKWLIGCVIAYFVVLTPVAWIALYGMVDRGVDPLIYRILCADEIVSEAISPDGKFMAQGVLTDCGATAPFTTDVRVRENRPWLEPYEQKNVLNVLDMIKVNLSWQDERTLVVEYEETDRNRNDDRKRINLYEEPWHDIDFVFHRME